MPCRPPHHLPCSLSPSIFFQSPLPMQDCEFTVQDGVLFMLQTRNGKRTGPAALQVRWVGCGAAVTRVAGHAG